MTTYTDIVNMIEAFAGSHLQINSFYSGKTWNFEANQNIYPSLIILPTTSTIQKGQLSITFNMIMADILNDDRSNLDFIYSNCLQILGDIFSYLNDNDNDLNYAILDEGFTAEPFEESFDDVLAGWIATITITIPFSNCNIPTN